MSLTNLDHIDQVLNNDVFQLGNEQEPCTIRFGVSKLFDQDKPNKTIKLFISDEEIQVFKNVDTQQIVNHEILHMHDNMNHINVKVNADTRIVHKDGSIASINELVPEQECLVILKPRRWKMEDKTGISLKCLAIRLIPKEMDFDFI